MPSFVLPCKPVFKGKSKLKAAHHKTTFQPAANLRPHRSALACHLSLAHARQCRPHLTYDDPAWGKLDVAQHQVRSGAGLQAVLKYQGAAVARCEESERVSL